MSNNNNNNDLNDPSDPSSNLSSKARLAYYLTGGTKRGPSIMTSLLRQAHQRIDVEKGSKEWNAARKKDFDEHQARWGKSGLAGKLEEVRGVGPKPRGMALVQWYRQEGGRRGGIGAGAATSQGGREMVVSAGQPAEHPLEHPLEPQEGQQEQQPENDIYGVSDEEQGPRGEKENGGVDSQDGAADEADHQKWSDDSGNRQLE
ncbi:hypothetical protein VP1G_04515 [Cytospora mali]|uniref:Uncharacterized protein n=1 Tax=Cytospora mali TaxID=578113 RepID=A0A194UZT3_CYTMA|nr:hypothetical protein VP1G_04515 [Valsa mali var. pyri (nom. inval.)]